MIPRFRARLKNKFPLFLPLLFSFFLFLFVCFNFTDSDILSSVLEKEGPFFANAGSFKSELDSFDTLIVMYEKSEENVVLNDFLLAGAASLKRDAVFVNEGGDESLSARIGELSGKAADKTALLLEAPVEEKTHIAASLRSDIATLKDMVDLSARQKTGLLKYTCFMWLDFLNKTVLAVSGFFLAAVFLLTLIAFWKKKKIAKLTALIGVSEDASPETAAEEIRKLTCASSAEVDELGKKLAREQIVGKRKEDLLNAIPEGLLTVSSGLVTFVNKTMNEWFGVNQSVIGENAKTVFEKIGTDGAEGKFSGGDETYQLSISKSQNEIFYIFRNITDSEELSSKLLNSERLASIGEMAARITHEIRNPLNTIKMNSTYLLDNVEKVGTEKKKQLLTLVVGEVERLEQITSKYMGMVNYSRSGAADNSGVSLPADLAEFLAFHRPELQKRNIVLELGKGEPLSLSISLSSFKEIMLNLLKNAWEELENGGKIAVNTGKNGSFAVVSVEDSGRGIPESEREAVFKNFYTNKPGGTGIGLSHSRKLATEAGGKLYVGDSKLGGAAFILELPLKRKAG